MNINEPTIFEALSEWIQIVYAVHVVENLDDYNLGELVVKKRPLSLMHNLNFSEYLLLGYIVLQHVTRMHKSSKELN